ncbi:hypothetical protein REPUB_Repub09cG0092700 [Reevesia pubescens]
MPIRVRQSHLIHTLTTIFYPIHHLLFPHHSLSNILNHKSIILKDYFENNRLSFSFSQQLVPFAAMAAMNSSVLACNYAFSGTGSSELNAKLASPLSVASPVVSGGHKLPVIRAHQAKVSGSKESDANEGRRAAMLYLAATLFTTAAASSANAGVIDDYLEKSKANKELNDKKRLATSGANFARAFTVEFGSCKFPENFTGCQDLAKQKVQFSHLLCFFFFFSFQVLAFMTIFD